ncbi:MAG: stage II sporulation protein R [Oscillospiraceae bacterium]|jgi:stage II sporulation protein R|nr:stage II sporulation protein R [Oscillospiraceae bacterium]
MRTLEKSLILGFIFSALLTMMGFYGNCLSMSDKIFRLHVLANSNSPEDQQLKLKVRDKILVDSHEKFLNAANKEEAKAIALSSLQQIKNSAQDEVKRLGFDYPVKVEVANSYFSTRNYDDVTLPAGKYESLKVSIGQGEGENWWCVMFPAMCIPAALQKEDDGGKSLKDVLDNKQVNIVENRSEYEFRFKTVEFIEWIKSLFNKPSGKSKS